MKSKLRLSLEWGLLAILVLVAIEAACQLGFRFSNGRWYSQLRQQSPRGMFRLHPYFGAALVPNASEERNGIHISHNSFGCRGPEFIIPKPAGRVRIAALGGSSTYCAGVSDNQTWEYFLNEELGTKYDVVNMGGPGGTSVEATAWTALLFSEVQPDVALYYLGWNDAQVQHVRGLRPDWADSHGKLLMTQVFRSEDFEQRTATGYLLRRMLFHRFFPRLDEPIVRRDLQGTPDALTDRIDQRALGLYERNLRNIVALCRKQGVQPVFIPQILNYAVLTSDKTYGWLPFVRDRDLKTMMAAYNQTMAKVAKEEGVGFVAEMLDEKFEQSDFVDNGHFSAAGNGRFAHILVGYLGALKANPQSTGAQR